VGDKKKVYGMDINSEALLTSLSPKSMSPKDGTKLFEVGVDVVGLPGMYRVRMDDQLAEAERTVMATTGLLQAAVGRYGSSDLTDTMWKSNHRHGLGRVKDYEGLAELITAVEESRESAFEQQDDQVYVFMSHRHYTERQIQRYQERGGLAVLTQATYQNYLALLNVLRQRFFDAPMGTPWAKTQSPSLLEHHSQKLLYIRGTSYSKRHFLIRTYVYLRDAYGAQFYHPSMTKHLWNQLTSLSSPGDRKGEKAGEADQTPDRCPHCRSRALHTKLNLPHAKPHCPFRGVDSGAARKAASKGVSLLQQNGQLKLEEMVAKALEG
jgi:hypothetical protein